MYSVRFPCEARQNIYIFVKFKDAYNSEGYGLLKEMGKQIEKNKNIWVMETLRPQIWGDLEHPPFHKARGWWVWLEDSPQRIYLGR